MMLGGKPDHESAPHARYKHDLAAKVDAYIKANHVQQPQQVAAAPVQPKLEAFKQPETLSNPFDMSDAPVKPVAQAQMQFVDITPTEQQKPEPPKKV